MAVKRIMPLWQKLCAEKKLDRRAGFAIDTVNALDGEIIRHGQFDVRHKMLQNMLDHTM
jgi:hypothetical protein